MPIVTRFGAAAVASLLALGTLTGCDEDRPDAASPPVETTDGGGGTGTATEPSSEPGAMVVVLNYDHCTYLGDRQQPGRFTIPVENRSPFVGTIVLAEPAAGTTRKEMRAFAARARSFAARNYSGPGPGSPPWGLAFTGTEMPPGGVSELPANVDSGTYVIVCSQRDPKQPWPPRAVYVAAVITVE